MQPINQVVPDMPPGVTARWYTPDVDCRVSCMRISLRKEILHVTSKSFVYLGDRIGCIHDLRLRVAPYLAGTKSAKL